MYLYTEAVRCSSCHTFLVQFTYQKVVRCFPEVNSTHKWNPLVIKSSVAIAQSYLSYSDTVIPQHRVIIVSLTPVTHPILHSNTRKLVFDISVPGELSAAFPSSLPPCLPTHTHPHSHPASVVSQSSDITLCLRLLTSDTPTTVHSTPSFLPIYSSLSHSSSHPRFLPLFHTIWLTYDEHAILK